jgi:hypothetical protein
MMPVFAQLAAAMLEANRAPQQKTIASASEPPAPEVIPEIARPGLLLRPRGLASSRGIVSGVPIQE